MLCQSDLIYVGLVLWAGVSFFGDLYNGHLVKFNLKYIALPGLEVEILPATENGGSLWVVLLSFADSIVLDFGCSVLSCK